MVISVTSRFLAGLLSIGLVLVTLTTSRPGTCQELIRDPWVDLAPDEAGFVLVVEGAAKGWWWAVTHKGYVVDQFFWESSLPLVKQYRLLPGSYAISAAGVAQPITIEAVAKKFALVQLEKPKPEAADLDHKATYELAPAELRDGISKGAYGLEDWTTFFWEHKVTPATAWEIGWLGDYRQLTILAGRRPIPRPPIPPNGSDGPVPPKEPEPKLQ